MTIELKGFEGLQKKLKDMPGALTNIVSDVLTTNAEAIAKNAKSNAATFKDMGGLGSSISADVSKPLEKRISVNANYAAFVEFGTGKFAAQRVGTLPADWQAFAAQYRGLKGDGGMQEFYNKMIAWVKRKGLTGLTAKGRRRTGKKADAEAAAIAYLIMRFIIKNGIRSQPFLYPAFAQQQPIIKKDIETVLKSL